MDGMPEGESQSYALLREWCNPSPRRTSHALAYGSFLPPWLAFENPFFETCSARALESGVEERPAANVERRLFRQFTSAMAMAWPHLERHQRI